MNMEVFLRLQRVVFFVVLIVISPVTSSEAINVGYVKGGLYEEFVLQRLKGLEPKGVELYYVETEGSKEQTELLRTGDIDMAILQGDIAYYAYEGVRGYEKWDEFSLALPLFEEYIHIIVRSNSDVNTLGRLLSGTISVGKPGSGAYQNASDLFSELGFRPGVDFHLRELSILDSLERLVEGTIDGAIYTGGGFPKAGQFTLSEFRVLGIPEDIIEALAIKSPYYSKAIYNPPGLENRGPINTVAVPSVLVASDRLDPLVLSKIIAEIVDQGDDFFTSRGLKVVLRKPESAIEQTPIPLHEGLRTYLRDEGHIGLDYSLPLIAVLVATLIGFVLLVQIKMRTYDRMGNLTATEGTFTYTLYQVISKSGSGLIVLFLFFLMVTAFVEAIQYFEDDYARRLNVRNPFADGGFWNSILWVITFMGAGDPGEVFPNSSEGKFLASILPFIGIGAVLGLGYSSLEQRRERRLRKRQGTLAHTVNDHILICGWNEKAPGIIYSLTSSGAPRKRKLTVIAEMEDPTPLDKYGFDLRYVSYCRGDSADHQVLENANARTADMAIVLGGVKKREGRNVKSVLSALALREITLKNSQRDEDLFILAELMFRENEKLFEVCGADAIVSSEAIVNRVAAMSCISPLAVDFVLDMLTYDEHCELYALPFGMISKMFEGSGKVISELSLLEISDILFSFGVTVVASHNTEFCDPIFLDHSFTGEKFSLLLDGETSSLRETDELLIIADDFKTVSKQISKYRKNSDEQRLKKSCVGVKPFAMPPVKKKRVLLVGELDRCSEISEQIAGISLVEVTIMRISDHSESDPNVVTGDFTKETTWREADLGSMDQVMILAKNHNELHGSVGDDPAELDAEVLLIAKFADMYHRKFQTGSSQVSIVAEMLCAGNQALFKDAGVNIVIPSDRMLERVIAKLIYSRGAATRFLMALLRLSDGKHFMSFEIPEPPADMGLADLRDLMPEYFQLLGVLPSEANGREEWINHVGDFGYHFLVSMAQANAGDYVAHQGDTVIGIVDRDRWQQNASSHP